MAVTRLQDDLLQHFREEKRLIQLQIDEMEPLSVSLRRRAAARLTGKGLILFGELLCWALLLAAVAAPFFLNKLYPFYQLYEPATVKTLGMQHAQALQWSVIALIASTGLLLFFLARALARIRQKNDILHLAGRRIKTLVGQLLQRKAAIDTLEQRHFNELPAPATGVNEVPNPGYDADEGVVYKIN